MIQLTTLNLIICHLISSTASYPRSHLVSVCLCWTLQCHLLWEWLSFSWQPSASLSGKNWSPLEYLQPNFWLEMWTLIFYNKLSWKSLEKKLKVKLWKYKLLKKNWEQKFERQFHGLMSPENLCYPIIICKKFSKFIASGNFSNHIYFTQLTLTFIWEKYQLQIFAQKLNERRRAQFLLVPVVSLTIFLFQSFA